MFINGFNEKIIPNVKIIVRIKWTYQKNEIVKKWIAGNVTLWGPVQVETIHCEDHCMVGTLMSECYSIEVAILILWGPLQVSGDLYKCQGLDV